MQKFVAKFNRFLPFWTVLRRELFRFWGIKRQTIIGPLLETSLYISVFGAALGSRINTLDGHPYIVFIIPGLLFMSFAINIFSNITSSLLQQKMQHAIDDQLSAPIPNTQLFMAFVIGGFVRASVIASIIYATAAVLIDDLPLVHPFMLIVSFIFIGFFFGMLGVLIGLWAEKFDDISLYQTFIIQPLIFLGGIFYSVSLLPPFFATLTKFDPIYYMINTIRYSMLGSAHVNVALSLSVIGLSGLVLFFINRHLFNIGYKLRP
jgi:ABC-2 type transport system permease protein